MVVYSNIQLLEGRTSPYNSSRMCVFDAGLMMGVEAVAILVDWFDSLRSSQQLWSCTGGQFT